MLQCLGEELGGRGGGGAATQIIHDEAKPTPDIPAVQVKSGQEGQGTAFPHMPTRSAT